MPRRRRSHFSYDRKLGAWRNAKGQFTRPPTWRQVRRDSIGRPLDDKTGRLVPHAAVRSVRRAPKKVREKVEKVAVETVGLADVRWTTTEAPIREERYPNYSHLNAKPPTEMAEVFERAMEGHLNKGPFTWSSVNIFEHGLLIRPHYGTFSTSFLNDVREILSDVSSQITVVQESDEVQSLKIHFGSDEMPTGASDVADLFVDVLRPLRQVWDLFVFHFEDVDWGVWWDTDEEMYAVPGG